MCYLKGYSMEINYRIQNKFLNEKECLFIEYFNGNVREVMYDEIEILLKNIRFIRHELSNYSYLYASQFFFDGHLNQNYWEFLRLRGPINDHDKNEVEDGVLLVLYLFYAQIFDCEGSFFLEQNNLYDIVNSYINAYVPSSSKNKKMKECIIFARENYNKANLIWKDDNKLTEEEKEFVIQFLDNNSWVYKIFVENYFVDLANSFESLRKATREFFESLKKNNT